MSSETVGEIAKALKTREASLIEELEQATRKSISIQSDATLHWEQYDIYYWHVAETTLLQMRRIGIFPLDLPELLLDAADSGAQAQWLSSRLIPHRHRPRAELQPAHEPQVDTLR